jgi:hypothetical protein
MVSFKLSYTDAVIVSAHARDWGVAIDALERQPVECEHLQALPTNLRDVQVPIGDAHCARTKGGGEAGAKRGSARGAA